MQIGCVKCLGNFLFGIMCLVAVLQLGGCHKPPDKAALQKQELDDILKLPAGKVTVDAGSFLWQKLKKGELPGGEKGMMLKGPDTRFQSTNYPMTQTWVQVIMGGKFANHFTVIRTSAEDSWQLQKAWRTDKNDVKVEDLPVP